MTVVSNTQITAYHICKQLHQYAHNHKLQPRRFRKPLRMGLVGHAVWEGYYKTMKMGCSVDECFQAATYEIEARALKLLATAPDDYASMNELAHLKKLLERYSVAYKKEPFEVLEVEKDYYTTIDSTKDVHFGIRLDLLVRFTKGPFYGDLAIIDHKFRYNFIGEAELENHAQGPKYIKVMRHNGLTVSKFYLNQIRYREMAEPTDAQLFRRTLLPLTKEKIDQVWRETESTAIEIVTNPAPIRRTLHPLVCKNCFFQKLCHTELNGLDSSNLVVAEYEPSMYGYNLDVINESEFV